MLTSLFKVITTVNIGGCLFEKMNGGYWRNGKKYKTVKQAEESLRIKIKLS